MKPPPEHRLTQAVGRRQQQEEQGEHGAGAGCRAPSAGGGRGTRGLAPGDPPAASNHPHSCAEPRPHSKQVGPVPPGSISYAWVPAGRRAENGHARGRGAPWPAPRHGTRLDPQLQPPQQGPRFWGPVPPFLMLGPPGEQSTKGKAVRRGRARRGGRATRSLLGSAGGARGRAAPGRPAAPAAQGLGQGGGDVVGPVGALGQGSPEIPAAQESPRLGAAGRQKEASSRVPTAPLAPKGPNPTKTTPFFPPYI